MSNPSVTKFGNDWIELRIHGSGDTGKGDRTPLLSVSDARILAYALLTEAERLGVRAIKSV